MPAKRPVPLSDAALGHQHPLPVKNTFIDVHTPTDGQPVSTAPAQVHYALSDFAARLFRIPEALSPEDSQGPGLAPGGLGMLPTTPPLMTPSPTATSLFSDARPSYALDVATSRHRQVPAVWRAGAAERGRESMPCKILKPNEHTYDIL